MFSIFSHQVKEKYVFLCIRVHIVRINFVSACIRRHKRFILLNGSKRLIHHGTKALDDLPLVIFFIARCVKLLKACNVVVYDLLEMMIIQ